MPQNLSPAATQTSTVQSPRRGRPWLSAVKALLLVVGLGYLGYALVGAVSDLRGHQAELRFSLPWVGASVALALLTFFVLVGAWVYILTALAGRRLPFLVAARIWFLSNLSIYIPLGPGWQILQMGVMSEEQGIGAIPATAAAVINAAINIACGMAVALIAGAPLLGKVLRAPAWLVWSAVGVAVLAVVALPLLLPPVFRIARERFHREVPLETPGARIVLGAAAANIAAWILYGLTLQTLSVGVLGVAAGDVWQYIAAFAAAYVAGYLAFVSPAGLVVRELTLSAVLVAGGLATSPQATILALSSRLALIVVQVVPALLFLAYRRRPPDETAKAAG